MAVIIFAEKIMSTRPPNYATFLLLRDFTVNSGLGSFFSRQVRVLSQSVTPSSKKKFYLKQSNFLLGVKSNPWLFSFRSTLLAPSLTWFAPSFQPIRCKLKNNRDPALRVFPRFKQLASFHLELSLVNDNVNLCSNCSLWLFWFWFYYTQLKTALTKKLKLVQVGEVFLPRYCLK